MPAQKAQAPKYQIDLENAHGVAIGDNLTVNLYLQETPLATKEQILQAIREANAALRDYPDEITGVHIERPEVNEIIEWICQVNAKEQLGMLLDEPGSGKTVVMHDVLAQLETGSVPVLAIKADFLSGITTRNELADRLGLPDTVEACARHLTAGGLFVVLLDQLDALSLSLSRDQSTLDVMLSTLIHLRNLDNMRIVASCRTFDLHNDPKLSQITTDRTFTLRPLPDEEINRVLHAIGIRPEHLLPAHRSLLATPLHLEVYARLVEPGAAGQSPEPFYSLQELYQSLWRKRIEVMPPDMPTLTERVRAIDRLVEVMQHKRQIAAPIATLDDHAEAARYLERVGFLRREKNTWLFFHQTLFDYCYARRFVAHGHALNQEILSGSQDLFARSQMIQVLAYLRGADEPAYHRELRALLFADSLRIHLRLLLVGWFGSLPNPTEAELQIARRLIQDGENQALFLQAVSGNAAWFDLLRETILPRILRSGDEQQIDLTVGLLATLIEERTEDVLAYLEPFLGSGEAWDGRIAYCLNHLKSWRSNEAVEILCDLFRRRRAFRQESSFLYGMRANPAAGCRVLRIYLDLRLDDIAVQLQAVEGDTPELVMPLKLRDRFNWEKHLLGEYGIGELMERAVQICPERVLESILPWFARATTTLSNPHRSEDDYPYDFLFASHWYSDHPSEGAIFARRMATVLHKLAEETPPAFRTLAEILAQVESLAVQRVLVAAYLSNPAGFTDDILVYLTADPRRFNIGEPLESPHFDSYRLVAAVFPHLDNTQQQKLEGLILDLRPAWENRGLGRQGFAQLQFLKAIPIELLGEGARKKRQELEHKFPDFQLSPPQGVTGGGVGPPIAQDAQAKMSNEAWLGAMRKYDDDTEWNGPKKDFLKGGVIELSRSFTERVKQEPERFYQLAQQFDETIAVHYVTAAITGLAESDAPPIWVFNLVRRFAHRLEGGFRRDVCWALSKRAKDGVPDDLLDMMTEWALHDPDPEQELWQIPAGGGQPYHGGDPHEYGINTNRGAAICAVAHTALKRTPSQFERLFVLMEWVSANDPSTAVRACVLDVLGPFLNQGAERTLNIFDRILAGHPALLQSPLTHRFLSWVYRRHFERARPYIETFLAHPDDSTRQAGARLACLAAFFYPEANELADQALTGDAAMRRGAAQVYARNLSVADISNVCRQRLLVLMDDPDENVREEVGRCFEDLQPEQMGEIRPFIDAFILSPALLAGARHLINYLKPLTADEQEMALQITTHILDMAGTDLVDIRTSTAILERDLVRLPLAVYTHATDPELKSQAMSLFERLLLIGSRSADQALADWDRR